MVRTSPATFKDFSQTIPDKAITAISVVPPPISTTILPLGFTMSIPIPIAAAIGSWIKYTSLPLTLSADSLTALISTSVIPDGIHITIVNEGENHLFFKVGILLINSLIIFSEASKSAMTPSFKGLIVFIFS